MRLGITGFALSRKVLSAALANCGRLAIKMMWKDVRSYDLETLRVDTGAVPSGREPMVNLHAN